MFNEKILERYLNLPQFTQNIIFVFITEITVLIFSTLSNIILARALGPEGQGQLYLVILVPWMLYIFFSLGIATSIIYFTGQKKYSPRKIAANALFIFLLISVIIGILYFAFLPLIVNSLLKNINLKLLKISFFIFPIMLIIAAFSGVVQGLQRIKQYSSIDILKVLSRFTLVLLLVVVFKMGINGALAATIGSFLAGLVLSLYFISRVCRIGISANLRIIKDLLLFGIKSHLGAVVQFFNYRLDMFLVKFFLNIASVGIYSISVLIAELIWYVPGAVSQVLLPKIASSDIKTANEFTPQVCRITLFVTAGCATILYFIGYPVIILFFGKPFLPSLSPLKILLPGVVALSVAKVLAGDLTGRGKPLYFTYTAAISLIITIALDLLLIPKLGVPGAALVSTISYTVSAVILSIIYSCVSGNRWSLFLCLRKEDLAVFRNIIKKA